MAASDRPPAATRFLLGCTCRAQRFHFKHNMYKLREERDIKPSAFGQLVSATLYERRFGPYFCQPVIGGAAGVGVLGCMAGRCSMCLCYCRLVGLLAVLGHPEACREPIFACCPLLGMLLDGLGRWPSLPCPSCLCCSATAGPQLDGMCPPACPARPSMFLLPAPPPPAAGLDPDGTPYLCGMDSIGAQETAKDFMVAGTATDSLLGICESLWRPDLVRYASMGLDGVRGGGGGSVPLSAPPHVRPAAAGFGYGGQEGSGTLGRNAQ